MQFDSKEKRFHLQLPLRIILCNIDRGYRKSSWQLILPITEYGYIFICSEVIKPFGLKKIERLSQVLRLDFIESNSRTHIHPYAVYFLFTNFCQIRFILNLVLYSHKCSFLSCLIPIFKPITGADTVRILSIYLAFLIGIYSTLFLTK